MGTKSLRSFAIVLTAPVLAASVTACSSSKFGSSAKTSAADVHKDESSANQAGSAVVDSGSAAPAAPSSDSADNAGGSGGGGGTDASTAKPIALSTSQISCLKKSALYNIVVVFDVSGSQDFTDPTKLRVTGAKDFLSKLSTYADATPAAKINVTITGFSGSASFGAHGWEALSSKTLPDLNDDIDKINAPFGLGTHYDAALAATEQLLAKQNASPADKNTRNFVIFMTDGEPNGPAKVADINAATAALTTKRGAAMIMLGTGLGVSAQGEAILKAMALPTTGIVNPKHIGQYHRVSTPADMAQIGSLLTADIASCEQ